MSRNLAAAVTQGLRRQVARHRRPKAAAITLAVAALLATGATVFATPASAAGARLGCPYGAVCVYPQNTVKNPLPFYSYGAHNLKNQFGFHRVLNNQYGGAGYKLCTGYGGRGSCSAGSPAANGQEYNLTPINSIVLTRPPAPCGWCPA